MLRHRPAITCAGVAALACALSCAANPANNQPDREKTTQRASQRFERAVLFKPKDPGLLGVEFTFAPLIVEDVQQAAATPPAADPQSSIPALERIVYHSSRIAKIGGEKFDQIEYVWMLHAPRPNGPSPCADFRGVRITLDHDGYPLVWEALSSEMDPHLVFVAESLEAEAKAAFGAPKSESRLALEPEKPQDSNAIIVAAIEQGPVPMGPYVYLSRPPERAIVNVLCRCSPSLVDNFVATPTYELRPLEVIEQQCPELAKKLGATSRLDSIMRWPRKR